MFDRTYVFMLVAGMIIVILGTYWLMARPNVYGCSATCGDHGVLFVTTAECRCRP